MPRNVGHKVLDRKFTSDTSNIVGEALDRAPFDPSVWGEAVGILSGQLKRSVEMARAFERILDQERSVAALLARSDDIAFVIDEDRALSAMNDTAEAHFRSFDLVSSKSNVISVLVPDIDSWVRQTLHCLARGVPLSTTREFSAMGRSIRLWSACCREPSAIQCPSPGAGCFW